MQEQLPTIDTSLIQQDLSPEEDGSRLIFVQEMSPDLQKRFQKNILVPYFQHVFDDLVMRSAPSNGKPSIDKVTLNEFL
jgi:hypothetical protein